MNTRIYTPDTMVEHDFREFVNGVSVGKPAGDTINTLFLTSFLRGSSIVVAPTIRPNTHGLPAHSIQNILS